VIAVRVEVSAMIENAIAAGTHSAKTKALCSGCDQWVDAIYLTPTGTRRNLCGWCAAAAGSLVACTVRQQDLGRRRRAK
jgi:hypothetical protein